MAVRRSERLPVAPWAERVRATTGGETSPEPPPVRLTLLRRARDLRGRHLLALDLVGIAVSAYAALMLRLDQPTAPLGVRAFPFIVVLLLASRTAVNIKLGLYRRRWRYASVPELLHIVGAATLGSLVAMTVFYGSSLVAGAEWTDGFPRSFWPIELLLSIALLGGLRFGIRMAADGAHAAIVAGESSQRALLYGAGAAGVLVARSALRDPQSRVRPVGFLDDDAALAGGIVAGLPVFGGLDSLHRAVDVTGATSVLITMPGAPGPAVRRVLEGATAMGLDVRTVPPVTDLIDGSVDAHRLRKVRVEDLLRRPPVTEHAVDVEKIIHGRTVLITGGAGSIGSELARQVFAIGPKRLVLVDRAESPLYMLLRELEARRERGRGAGDIQIILANVANRAAMRRLIDAESPSVIFHAAAYKHVPMMEDHPSDAVHVNMGGTMSVLDAAAEAGVERFVFVSTDKAVRPSSVMGASKRIGEMLVEETARRTGRPYVSVRFGNVLGSTGSVVPIFREQLENGEPLTITHPDMTRYFMTIPEAAWLILDAAAMGRTGDLFVLDMGEPVRVVDLARDLVRLAGRDPSSQPMEVIGLRPGEKLHEELFYDRESVIPTASPNVMRTISPEPPAGVREAVMAMLALATGENERQTREAVLRYIRAHDALARPERGADRATSDGGNGHHREASFEIGLSRVAD